MATETGAGAGGTPKPPAKPKAPDASARSNTREGAGYVILDRLGAPTSLIYFMVAWMEAENGEAQAKYNNPLNVAAPNVPEAYRSAITGKHGTVGIANFSALQYGCWSAVGMLTRPGRYTPLLTMMRAGNEAGAAAALHNSGWCGGKNLCPGYGAGILAKAKSYRADAAKWNRSKSVPAGTTYVMIETPSDSELGVVEEGIGPVSDFVPDWADGLGSALGWITTADNWRKIGFVALGVTLAAVGVGVIVSDTKAGQAAIAVASKL